MFFHAQDAALGVLVSRYTAGGDVGDALAEVNRAVRAFDAVPCAHVPKLHLIEVDEGASLPTMADRAALAEIARATRSPRWMACVVPSRQARLVVEIVLLLSPKPAGRRIQTFTTRAAALAWLLTPRPEAQSRLLSLAGDVDHAARRGARPFHDRGRQPAT